MPMPTRLNTFRRTAGSRALMFAGIAAFSSLFTACATSKSSRPVFQSGQAGAIARARADSMRLPYVQADIDFMNGMIHHHAQAITIARWGPSHGADAAVQR